MGEAANEPVALIAGRRPGARCVLLPRIPIFSTPRVVLPTRVRAAHPAVDRPREDGTSRDAWRRTIPFHHSRRGLPRGLPRRARGETRTRRGRARCVNALHRSSPSWSPRASRSVGVSALCRAARDTPAPGGTARRYWHTQAASGGPLCFTVNGRRFFGEATRARRLLRPGRRVPGGAAAGINQKRINRVCFDPLVSTHARQAQGSPRLAPSV